ncbi:virulence RhuM family protein [bacterium]|nr:virulence RhuM family protein [bacterium]
MPQKKIAELFDVKVPAISKHLNNIYDSGELQKEATVSILETVQNEGERKVARAVEFYNLDAIIAVGYRVNSNRATQFRMWATNILQEYIIKGYTMDVERLNNAGKVTAAIAKSFAEAEFEKYRIDKTTFLKAISIEK